MAILFPPCILMDYPGAWNRAMDVRQLRYFMEVVQAKSFTKAAERVRVAQPALGFQVRKLEDELGSRLLVRHSRGVRTTEAGDALLKHAHAILRQIELAKQEVIDLAGPPRGPLALGVTPTASALLATRIVQKCSAAFPGIALNLVEGLSEEVMKWLDEGRIDLGFTYNPTAVKGIETKALLMEDLFYISPLDDDIDGAEKIALGKLRNRPMILPSRPHGTRMLVERAAEERDIPMHISCEVDSVATVRELVEAGIGATILPIGAVLDAVRSGRLHAVRISRPRISRTLHLAWSSRSAQTNAATVVCDIVETLAKERIESGDGFWRAP